MDCRSCGGACCESFSLPVRDIRAPNADAMRWVKLHGTEEGSYLTFECRCSELTEDGRCGIYEKRPLMCRLYEAGGKDCLETVRKRRSREQYEAIREPGDPLVGELYG